MTDEKPRLDIRATSTVKAQYLRFHSTPEVDVGFTEDAESETTSKRSGFPKPVNPGVDYTDVRIDYRLAAKATDKPFDGDDNADEG